MKRNKTQKWKRRNQLENPRKEKKDGEMILEKLVHFMRHKRKGKSCIAIATHYLKT